MLINKKMIEKQMLLETTEKLEELCQTLAHEEFICIDLEFLREHTYFAKPCLIQIASVSTAAAVDPLAHRLDLTSFFALLQNQNIVKVFHSGRQDIEILYNLSSQIPTPLFDTQIAAQAFGFGESVSYENLVSRLLHIELDKSSRLSDWSRRPLSDEQIKYALADVTHMVNLYQRLKGRLEKEGKQSWIQDELDELADISLYQINPADVWQKMRHRSHSPLFLTTLRELAAWREKRAISKNVPRQSFIKDDILLNICAARPRTKQDLAAIRGMRADIAAGKIGDEIIEILQKVNALDKTEYVALPKSTELSSGEQSLLELLKLLLKLTAQKENIVPKMIASEDDLKQFCQNHTCGIKFLQDWRYEVFGKYAQNLCCGKTAIAYNDKTRKIDFISLPE